MTTTSDQVRQLARSHGVKVPIRGDDHAHDFAVVLNRLEGVEGDDTLILIAQLLKGGFISYDRAGELTIAHSREIDR